jgi:hypothetical protein
MRSKLTVAIPRQQWLRERATVLRYMYIAYIVCMSVDRKLGIYSTNCSGGMTYTTWIARFLPILLSNTASSFSVEEAGCLIFWKD